MPDIEERAQDAAILENYISQNSTAPIPDSTALGDVEAQKTIKEYASGKKEEEKDSLEERRTILADKKLSNEEKQAELKALALQEQAEAQAKKQAEAKKTIVPPVVQATGETIVDHTKRAEDWLASLPTPGGIGALLLALVFFVWCIVPVGQNGETRAYLLFLTLTGRTQLAGAVTLQPEFGPSLPLPTTIFGIPTGGGNTTPNMDGSGTSVLVEYGHATNGMFEFGN